MSVGYQDAEDVRMIGGPLDGHRHRVEWWPVEVSRTLSTVHAGQWDSTTVPHSVPIEKATYTRLVAVGWDGHQYVLGIFDGWPSDQE